MRLPHRLALTASLVGLVMAAAVAVGGEGVCCDPPPSCKTCRPTAGVKKTTKYVYGCKEKDVCLPRCGNPFHRSCDESCAGARVRTVRQLVKKAVTEEKCETKWVVEHVAPSCPPPDCVPSGK